LGTPDLGHQTERKRRRVTRLVLGVLVTTVLGIVVYRWRTLRPDKHEPHPRALPVNVNQQQSGFSFTRSDNGRQVFTVHAARTTAFNGGGETVLNDVWVEVFGRSGNRHDLIRTRACNYNRESGELMAKGKVEIEINAPPGARPDTSSSGFAELNLPDASQAGSPRQGRIPVFLETSHLSFVDQGDLAVSDAPVRFRAGNASGTAQGLAYATRDEWVELKKNVVVEMQPRFAAPDAPPLRLEASRLRFEKGTGTVTLWGPVLINQADRRLEASSGKIFLDARNRITAAELEGGVTLHGHSRGGELAGSAQQLRAEFEPQTMQLISMRAEKDLQVESKDADRTLQLSADSGQVDFSGKPARPATGQAEGNVHLASETAPGATPSPGSRLNSPASLRATRQELTTGGLKFSFRSGGDTLQEASTAGPGKIVLVPHDPKVGPRLITADSFQMEFDRQGQPATLRGLGQAHLVFTPPPSAAPGTPDAVTYSDRLIATFDPTEHTLSQVNQSGAFRFEQGEQRAFADNARYETRTEVVTLTGHPRVEDGQTSARADRILLDTDESTAEGLGHVQSTHLETAGRSSGGQAREPTHIVADRMLAERDSQFVHYQGHVRLWSGGDVIESAALDVFKAQGRVQSGSRVLTCFLQSASESADSSAKQPAKGNSDVPVTIQADDLEYFEQGRKAIYRGNVRLETQNTTLRTDRLDVFLTPSNRPGASAVERAVAEGHVTVVQPTRRATGERAEYFAGPGKILVTGGPPALYDAQKGFTTGRQLTFFLRDDRIFLDGGEKSPTLSKHRIPQ
jgi:lipopolysaccharide export system protein LptA